MHGDVQWVVCVTQALVKLVSNDNQYVIREQAVRGGGTITSDWGSREGARQD